MRRTLIPVEKFTRKIHARATRLVSEAHHMTLTAAASPSVSLRSLADVTGLKSNYANILAQLHALGVPAQNQTKVGQKLPAIITALDGLTATLTTISAELTAVDGKLA